MMLIYVMFFTNLSLHQTQKHFFKFKFNNYRLLGSICSNAWRNANIGFLEYKMVIFTRMC